MTKDNPEAGSVIVAGEFVRNSAVVPQSLSQILIATGIRSSDHKPVLIPYVEMSLQIERPVKVALESRSEEDGDDQVEMVSEEWISQTLPLENAFWLTLDMLRDLSIACDRLLKTMPEGALLESDRLDLAHTYVEEAEAFAEQCRRSLAALSRQAKKLEAGSSGKRTVKVSKSTAAGRARKAPSKSS